MNDEQFDALANLLRLRAGPARGVAYRVLVLNESVPDAAAAERLEYRAAHRAVQRVRKGLALVNKVSPRRVRQATGGN